MYMYMKLRHLLLFILFCMLTFSARAQDVHYSYYQFAPTIVNPALTGAFYGNIRATAITRGQWTNVGPANVGNDGYTPTSLLIDGNLPFGFRKGDWVSLGINILMEGSTAGVTNMRRSFNGISAAYHLSLAENQSTVLTAAVKYGKYGITNAQSDGSTPFSLASGNIPVADDDDYKNYFLGAMNGDVGEDTNDWTVGLMLTTPMGKNADMRIGLAADHLLQPRLGPDSTGVSNPNLNRNRLSRRINAFVQYYTDLTDKITLNPSIVYQSMGNANNILIQGLIGFTPNPEKDITLNLGLGVRLADNMDVPFYAGIDYKDWRVGLAFDANISGLVQATSNAGAYELAVSKIFSWEKKVKVKPVFICPRL